MESIHCAFSNVIYPSAASASSDGFMIAEYRSRDSRLHDSILGDFFKASGRNLPHESGNFYTLYGEWVYNKKHSNYVLQVDSFDPYIPQEKGQIIKYLSSLGDVGKDNAEKIFSTFGLKSMEVLEKKPELLIKVKNINKEDLKNIITYFQKRLSVGQVAEFLLGYNLPRSKATQVYEALGDDAVFLIEDNPFHLTKTTGISFQDVDKVPDNAVPIADCVALSVDMQEALRYIRGQYKKRPSILRGLEAIVLNVYGYKFCDIAKMWQMGENHLTAIVSRTRSVLRKDNELLRLLQFS